MQKKLGDVFKRGAVRLGDALKTFEEKPRWSRLSTQTSAPSPLDPTSSNGSTEMPPKMEEIQSSSLSFRKTGSASLVASNEQAEERERDVELVIKMKMFGTRDQVISSGRSLLRIMHVKGYQTSSATIDGFFIEAAEP